MRGTGKNSVFARVSSNIYGSVVITKIPLGRVVLKEKNNEDKCDFLKIFFSQDFLKLSGLVIQHHYWFRNTASKLYGEILYKSRYFMEIHFVLALRVRALKMI